MNLTEFQQEANRTLLAEYDFEPSAEEWAWAWYALNVAAQASTLIELVKKQVFHRHPWDEAKLREARLQLTVAVGAIQPQPLAEVQAQSCAIHMAVVWQTLGLTGEAGEFAKKVVEELNKGNTDAKALAGLLREELGDVWWYVPALATKLGLSLEEVADALFTKLDLRYKTGYSSQASLARVDVK